ncbi:MAG: PAS-domain containing protein [Roseovarius sp.]|jgi:PAS domain-containing protein|nr:PAS-domain containing protein [Roseovarius sp.]
MVDLTVSNSVILGGLVVAFSFAVLWLIGMGRTSHSHKGAMQHPVTRANSFLFRDESLIDHDASTMTLPKAETESETDWHRMRRWLGFRFPNLPERLGDLTADLEIESNDGGLKSRLEFSPGKKAVHLTLSETLAPDSVALHETLRQHALLEDRAAALSAAPMPVWATDQDGTVIWENLASEALADDHKEQMLLALRDSPDPGISVSKRVSLENPVGPSDLWYDLKAIGSDAGALHYAADITRIIRAETIQREFVQTLAKTFAHLTTGLAVFDRSKNLALFNPALIDLTALSPEYLSARPSLISFFDTLRDRQVMPEPKNYASWRSQINDMVKTAAGGLYQEVWSLPSGQTYRVIGRPHPDGAVAFLFEDISVEILATRRHRMQMDLRQTVLDQLDEGVAVLSAENRLMFCNKTLGSLLGIDPDGSFADMGLSDLLAACHTRYPDVGLWAEVEEKITRKSLSSPIIDTVGRPGGDGATCRVMPLGGGVTMLCLTQIVPEVSGMTTADLS